MTDTTDWNAEQLEGEPRFLVGWRTAKSFECMRIDVHRDVFGELRDACEPALAILREATARPYEPFAELERGEEYFEFALQPGPSGDLSSSLHVQAQAVDQLSVLDADEIRRHRLLLYGICWPRRDGGFLCFVTKQNPQRQLEPGVRFFQFGSSLKRVERPDLAISDGADVVLRPMDVAILRPTAFKDLFTDIEVAFAEVPTYVATIAGVLVSDMPLTPASAAALEAAGRRKLSVARRLRLLNDRLLKIQTDAPAFRKHLKRFGFNPLEFIDRKNNLVFDEARVERFLDFAEGRLYEDELGGEQRRADRYSSIVRD